MTDPALATLFLPLETGEIELSDPSQVLFMRARSGTQLSALRGKSAVFEQSFAPDRDSLESAGFVVTPETDAADFDLVMVLPGRQRQESRAQLAKAATRTKPGGTVIACATNTEGAKSLEADISALLGTPEKLTKHKCRCLWAAVDPELADQRLMQEWADLDGIRPIMDGAYLSRPGVFAWDRIDPASQLLADHLPDTLSGRGADLGAGLGFLARHVLENAPKVTGIDLYEAEKRALDLAEQNLSTFKGKRAMNGIWSDVTKGLDGPYDFLVSNPPFHQTGKADRSDIGQAFIRAASEGLRGGGTFWMVANRHLPYEHALSEAFASFNIVADQGGYKVIKAVKAKGR
ncbi:16S rRNA m(2)G 1207 methyltransferase [Roseibium hamelinense]|uniref:16S rRNA m(2)G 1207 methyltransferase n=1 Tax=Roseibium hamelinense TaxID=150831 RepID=A0A562T254_9HYPH|nr:class I SAM-dependent methyltransferase [Roseibium hamelinense]MTI44466.1 class I SAM-dependent methyltransferase [Roseibium hamelinense]TWI87433.1 16S rRNA m(2)G 1207 methyltransferase [Roseibium hamelinense]